MPDKVFLTALVVDGLFLATGALVLGFCLVVQSMIGSVPANGEDAVRNLIYEWLPLKIGLVNAAFIIFTFLFTLPGLMTPGRSILKTSSYMVIFCGVFTLCVGVYIWVLTLQVKQSFFPVYLQQDSKIQSMIQISYGCCGYMNSNTPAFITDPTCPSPAAAALRRGCATSISSFANNVMDQIFTAVFGMVGVDFVLILCIACVLKVRKERDRYRHIDDKNGFRQF